MVGIASIFRLAKRLIASPGPGANCVAMDFKSPVAVFVSIGSHSLPGRSSEEGASIAPVPDVEFRISGEFFDLVDSFFMGTIRTGENMVMVFEDGASVQENSGDYYDNQFSGHGSMMECD